MATHLISTERDFTETELAERGTELARILHEIEEVEAQKKQAADDYKAAIGKMQERVDVITHEINLGFERVDVEADIFLNTPEKGKKSYIDIHTTKVVKVEDMTEQDKQARLFDEDQRPDQSSQAAAD